MPCMKMKWPPHKCPKDNSLYWAWAGSWSAKRAVTYITCTPKQVYFLSQLFGLSLTYLDLSLHILSCLELFGAIKTNLELFGPMWTYLTLLDLFCTYKKVFGEIWSYLELFEPNWNHLELFKLDGVGSVDNRPSTD